MGDRNGFERWVLRNFFPKLWEQEQQWAADDAAREAEKQAKIEAKAAFQQEKETYFTEMRPALEQEEQTRERDGMMVNYLWIFKDKIYQDPDGDEDTLSKVPLSEIAQAIDNANMYPDADVKIWLDFTQLDPMTKFWVESFVYDGATHKNIEVCDLNDIPEYRYSEVMHPDPEDYRMPGIWEQVDLAKLYVIDHAFRTTGARDVYFADFDIEDIGIEAERHKDIMDEFEFVFGSAPVPPREPGETGSTVGTLSNGRKLENQFMGFRHGDMSRRLRTELIPDTTYSAQEQRVNGWWDVVEFANAQVKRLNADLEEGQEPYSKDDFVVDVGHQMYHKMVPHPLVVELNADADAEDGEPMVSPV